MAKDDWTGKCDRCGAITKLLLNTPYCTADCDKKKKIPSSNEIDLDWDTSDVKTDPGYWYFPGTGGSITMKGQGTPRPVYSPNATLPGVDAEYICMLCQSHGDYLIDAVAAGACCPCGGPLRMYIPKGKP